MATIPRVLHFIWVGDESKRPDNYINTWRYLNPDFEIKVWGNAEWENGKWLTRKHMDLIARNNCEYAGVADLMRWEILAREGGFALDADSICIQTLPNWIFDCNLFACWENEYAKPGLVANGYVGAMPGHPVVQTLVERFVSSSDLSRHFVWYKLKTKSRSAWKTTGPVPFTEELFRSPSRDVTILPSHFFLPRHYSGVTYGGGGPIYSCEMFSGSKAMAFNAVTQVSPVAVIQEARKQLGLLDVI